MKKINAVLITLLLITGCNDGDIIVTNVDFGDASLQNCNETGESVFFKINQGVNESISLLLKTNEELFLVTGTQQFQLSEESNIMNYRSFDTEVTNNYFCSPIPPTSPVTLTEYLGYSGVVNLESITVLNDNDGVVEVESTLDTDNDDLLNYYDFDDDGDNIPTSLELGDNDPETPPIDTDGDTIPDYLDNDDDNDGIPTINEDEDGDLNPLNDLTNGVPNYLNGDVTISRPAEAYIEHAFNRTSDGFIFISNLTLFNAEEALTFNVFNLGSIEGVRNETVLETPPF